MLAAHVVSANFGVVSSCQHLTQNFIWQKTIWPRHHSQQLSAFGNTCPPPSLAFVSMCSDPLSDDMWKAPYLEWTWKVWKNFVSPVASEKRQTFTVVKISPFWLFLTSRNSRLTFVILPALKSAAIFTDQNHIFADKKPFLGFTRFVNKKSWVRFFHSLSSYLIYHVFRLSFTFIQKNCLQNVLHFYIFEQRRQFDVIYQKCFTRSV